MCAMSVLQVEAAKLQRVDHVVFSCTTTGPVIVAWSLLSLEAMTPPSSGSPLIRGIGITAKPVPLSPQHGEVACPMTSVLSICSWSGGGKPLLAKCSVTLLPVGETLAPAPSGA